MLKPKTSADVYLEEAGDLLEKGDVVQACEKYYKAAEEAIIILSYGYKIEIKNRDPVSLENAVYLLSKFLGEEIVKYWATAIMFLTAREYMDKELVEEYMKDVKNIVYLADKRNDS
ncbi:PaREP1 family protein [Acidianus sp. HS-5]|uniref:PaREP1 family protein n=1 Tax=Acidianus sp. HS-5 TaxID=2886040 RepID=UPI001F3BF1CD|nr:PaREP1 family protein [Acidianus sp. HS-5]BDC18009.1 hypothetical protein HS5_08990 [Acidianus sp. HS-5]